MKNLERMHYQQSVGLCRQCAKPREHREYACCNECLIKGRDRKQKSRGSQLDF